MCAVVLGVGVVIIYQLLLPTLPNLTRPFILWLLKLSGAVLALQLILVIYDTDNAAVVSWSINFIGSDLTIFPHFLRFISDGWRKLLRLTAINTLRVVLSYLGSFIAGAAFVVITLVFNMVFIGSFVRASTKELLLFPSSALVRVILRFWKPICQIQKVLRYANCTQQIYLWAVVVKHFIWKQFLHFLSHDWHV